MKSQKKNKKAEAKGISLMQWITRVTRVGAKHYLGVSEANIRHWHSGHCLPRARTRMKIKQISNGLVDFDLTEKIYFSKANAKNRWDSAK